MHVLKPMWAVAVWTAGAALLISYQAAAQMDGPEPCTGDCTVDYTGPPLGGECEHGPEHDPDCDAAAKHILGPAATCLDLMNNRVTVLCNDDGNGPTINDFIDDWNEDHPDEPLKPFTPPQGGDGLITCFDCTAAGTGTLPCEPIVTFRVVHCGEDATGACDRVEVENVVVTRYFSVHPQYNQCNTSGTSTTRQFCGEESVGFYCKGGGFQCTKDPSRPPVATIDDHYKCPPQ